MPQESILGYLSYRVVNRVTGAEVISRLPHLHQSTWTIRAMQQGAPGSSAIGNFTIPLFPPGSDEFRAAYALYQKLLPGSGEGYRVEAYRGDIITSATPTYAGTITNVSIDLSGTFTLSGQADPWTAHTQRPFPGEIMTGDAGGANSLTRAQLFMGENLPSFSDQFTPFTAGNYTSTNLPALTAGTWSAATDGNGVNSNVVTCTTGTGAVLMSKTSTAATKDTDFNQYVEAIVRLKPTSTDASNAGQAGVGFSTSSVNANTAIVGYVTIKSNAGTGRYDLDARIRVWVASALSVDITASNALTNIDDPDGYIPLQIQLLTNSFQTALVVNGSVVAKNSSLGIPSLNPGTTPFFPLLMYGIPATSTTVCYSTNLLQGTRHNAASDSTTAPFIVGSTDTASRSFGWYTTVPPTFLELWTAAATLQSWYWRYTPVYMKSGVRTMGKVDFQASPGTDLSGVVRFVEGDNLIGLTQQGNADVFGSDITFNGPATTNGGGIGYGRNLTAMANYGWLSDVGMSMTAVEYTQLARQAALMSSNKGTPGASITATVLRDPFTVDRWRELDSVTLHAPTVGLNNSKQLILSYTYTEGSPTQQVTLAQYAITDATIISRRMMPGLALIAGQFKSR